jgi:N-acetyl-anhydromuramyl-L-alanine amidase AmpD
MGTIRKLPLVILAVLALFLPAFAGEEEAAKQLESLKERIRAEVGIEVAPATTEAVPPEVEITVLPGDTHLRLAQDMTGSAKAEKLLKSLAPALEPGKRLKIPRTLLLPPLADHRSVSFRLNEPHISLWSLVNEELDPENGDAAFVAVRNVQRLNHIADPSKMVDGQKILVPEALLPVTFRPRPSIFVFRDYRCEDLKNLKRQAPSAEIPEKFVQKLKKNGLWEQQTVRPSVDMVVVHTTEHEGVPFDNVANYIRKNRLANYLIGPGGDIYEVIPERFRSFGCGQSLWNGVYNVDHRAINIELYADTATPEIFSPITTAQYEALKSLLEDIYARRPEIHPGRVLTHKMVALNYKYEMRSRKGDPYVFDWTMAGLPDNSALVDQDLALGRAVICDNKLDAPRITYGQTEAMRIVRSL